MLKRSHSVLGVKDVRCRRVVHYDDVAQLSAESTQVFDVVSSVEHAGFPKESRPKYSPLVQEVGHRVSVLKQRFTGSPGKRHDLHYNLLSINKANRTDSSVL